MLAGTMRRFRSVTAKSVKRLLHITGISAGYAKNAKPNFIIMFHIVRPSERARFASIVKFLVQNFTVVDIDRFVDEIENPARSPREKGLAVISFDDGLRHHAEIVYPILRELHVPAIFYVCPDLIGDARSIWTWEVWARLERLGVDRKQRLFGLAGLTGDSQTMVDWMKTIPVDRREQIEREIHDCTRHFEYSPDERYCFELMNWELMQKLDPSLITIGSHTATHVDLPQADPERLERELSMSKQILESRLNRKVQHFCYPNGNFSDAIVHIVGRYYRSAVTTRPAVVRPGENLLLIPRIGGDALDLPGFVWELASGSRRKDPS